MIFGGVIREPAAVGVAALTHEDNNAELFRASAQNGVGYLVALHGEIFSENAIEKNPRHLTDLLCIRVGCSSRAATNKKFRVECRILDMRPAENSRAILSRR